MLFRSANLCDVTLTDTNLHPAYWLNVCETLSCTTGLGATLAIDYDALKKLDDQIKQNGLSVIKVTLANNQATVVFEAKPTPTPTPTP